MNYNRYRRPSGHNHTVNVLIAPNVIAIIERIGWPHAVDVYKIA